MIAFEIAGKIIEVDRSSLRFNLTYRSPLFNNLTSFIFNFVVPSRPDLLSAFNFPLRFNRINRERIERPGRVLFDNTVLASGTWTAYASSEEVIELSFDFVADDFIRSVAKLRIPAVFDQTITPENLINHVEETVLLSYPETEYQFPAVYNPDFYADENPAFLGIINNFEGDFVNDTFNANTIIPMPYMFAIIKRIFTHAGYDVSGNIFNDEVLSKAVLYSNHALDNLYAIVFSGETTDVNTSAANNFRIMFVALNDEGNNYNPSIGKYNFASEGTYLVGVEVSHEPLHTPSLSDIYRIEVIHKVGASETVLDFDEQPIETLSPKVSTFSLSVPVTSSLGELYVRQRYWNSGTEVISKTLFASITITNDSGTRINIYQKSFNLKNHVPDYDILEFLVMFFEEYQVFPAFDKFERKVRLVPFIVVRNSPPHFDLTQGLVRNTLRAKQNDYKGLRISYDYGSGDGYASGNFFVPDRIDGSFSTSGGLDVLHPGYAVFFIQSLNAYYVKSYNDSTETWDWKPLTDKSEIFEDGAAGDSVLLKFVPCVMRNSKNRLGNHRAMPGVLGAGTSHAYRLKNDCPLRLMIYQGYGGGLWGNNRYPFATTSQLDTLGNVVMPYNYNALEIAQRFWNEKISWLKVRQAVEFDRRFTHYELQALDMLRLHMLTDSTIIIEEMFVACEPDLRDVKIKAFTAN